jgi:hypothetical protein
VKDFIREYGKVVGIFAAAAFVLSFLVGLFTGNPFGVVLLRAFLLAILSGALGLGFTFTVKKFLPELMGWERDSAPAEAEPFEKHSVDIVLPEEDPFPRRPLVTPSEADSDVEEAAEVLSEGSSRAASEPEEIVSEPEELTEETLTENTTYREQDNGLPEGGGELFPGESSATDSKERGDKKHGGLDGLPEIDIAGALGGSGRHELEEHGPIPAGGKDRPRARKPEDAAREFIGDEDPEILAKAIRTVMKRDERG